MRDAKWLQMTKSTAGWCHSSKDNAMWIKRYCYLDRCLFDKIGTHDLAGWRSVLTIKSTHAAT